MLEKHSNLKNLITKNNLKRVGALSDRVGTICKFRMFRNGKPVLSTSEKEEGKSIAELVETDGASYNSYRLISYFNLHTFIVPFI